MKLPTKRRPRTGSADQLNRAIERVYDAASGAESWSNALSEIVRFVGNSGTHLFMMSPIDGLVGRDAYFGMPEKLMADYNGDKIRSCPRLANARAHPDRVMLFDYQHTDERGIDHSEYYAWLRQRGDGIRYYLGGRLNLLDGEEGYLSLAFREQEGHAQSVHIERMGRLLGHVNRALQLSQQVQTLRLSTHQVLSSLAVLDVGLVLLDARGKVTHVNATADALRLTGDLYTIVNNELRLSPGRSLALLQQQLAAATSGFLNGAAQVLGDAGSVQRRSSPVRVYSPTLDAHFEVTVAPVRSESLPDSHAGHAIAVLWRRSSTTRIPSENLRHHYGLTPAEWRVAVSLAAGQSLPDTAKRLGISHHTARSYLKSIFTKTGAKHQAQLVVLLLADTEDRL